MGSPRTALEGSVVPAFSLPWVTAGGWLTLTPGFSYSGLPGTPDTTFPHCSGAASPPGTLRHLSQPFLCTQAPGGAQGAVCSAQLDRTRGAAPPPAHRPSAAPLRVC